MLTFLAFLIVILGGIDWLLVGLLQYDYVAGLFGYQASIFSRLVYIVVGVATVFIVIKAIAGKGKLDLVNFRFKFGKKKDPSPSYNISASHQKNNQLSGKDYSEQDKYNYMKEENPFHEEKKSSNNLFDDMKN